MTPASLATGRHKLERTEMLMALVICTLALTGCSSAEDKIYKGFRCAKIASLLGESSASKKAMGKILLDAERLTTSENPRYLEMKMNERFQDDVPLYRYGPKAQEKVLTSLYESSECQGYYK